jgi:hypothetical protein
VQSLLDRSVANLQSALRRVPPVGSPRGAQLKAAVQIELAMVHEEYAPSPAALLRFALTRRGPPQTHRARSPCPGHCSARLV